MKYDELLNHKSILDCENPRDEEQHGKDKVSMLGKIDAFGKYGAIVKMQPVDKAHKKDKEKFYVVGPEDYYGIVEGCDLKNGTDMVIHNGLFGIAAYGQGYTMGLRKESHMVETLCSYRFLNEKADLEKLEEMEQKELSKEFEKDSNFLNTEEFLWDLRNVKRKDLDALIQAAEEKIGGSDGGRDSERTKDNHKDKEK